MKKPVIRKSKFESIVAINVWIATTSKEVQRARISQHNSCNIFKYNYIYNRSHIFIKNSKQVLLKKCWQKHTRVECLFVVNTEVFIVKIFHHPLCECKNIEWVLYIVYLIRYRCLFQFRKGAAFRRIHNYCTSQQRLQYSNPR